MVFFLTRPPFDNLTDHRRCCGLTLLSLYACLVIIAFVQILVLSCPPSETNQLPSATSAIKSDTGPATAPPPPQLERMPDPLEAVGEEAVFHQRNGLQNQRLLIV
jgi:hypothetical protein